MDSHIPEPASWVAFDLDGTLTAGETLAYFLRAVLGPRRFSGALVRSVPEFLGYALGTVPNYAVKERVLTRTIAGMPLEELETHGARFAEETLPGLLRPAVWQRFVAHRDRGDRLVLVTATLGIYAQPWAEAAGFHAVIATGLECDQGRRITGRLAGKNCFGPEKARRLQEECKIQVLDHAYGNSRGDLEMLQMARHPVCISRKNAFGRLLTPLAPARIPQLG